MSDPAQAAPAPAPHLLTEREEHVLVVTMNRPERRNAWSLEMLVRMADAWAEAEADEAVRVVVLTGAEGNFCSGSDLKEMHGDHSGSPWHARTQADPELHWRAMLRSQRLSKPLIAAVEGYALAGGTELLQATDIRIAGSSAVFGLTEATLGLFPLGGSTVRLQRQVPYTKAAELLLTGRRFGAGEAERMGLVGRIVDDGEALAEALRVARQIAANGPLAVQAILRSMRETADLTEAEGLKRELELGWPVFQSEDAREGPRAFAEKRKPVFKGV